MLGFFNPNLPVSNGFERRNKQHPRPPTTTQALATPPSFPIESINAAEIIMVESRQTDDATHTGGGTSSSWSHYISFGEAQPRPLSSSTNKAPPTNDDHDDDDVENPGTMKKRHPGDKGDANVKVTAKTPFRQQLRLFFAMAIPYFRESGEGRCLFFGLIVLMLLDSGVRVAFSYLARDFWTALGDKDMDQFYGIIRNFMIALLCLAPINVFYRFQRQRLAIRWRQWMTDRILQLYLFNPHQIYYQLERQMTTMTIDNPDQRLAEDVRSFTEYSLSFFLTITVSIIDLTAFSAILYTIEPKLFFSIIGFATLGTVVTMLLGSQLVRLNFERLQREADFRLSLVRVRANAESIAFFGGEVSEGKGVSRRFSSVVTNAFDIIGTQRNLEFFTRTYNYLTWILPVVVIAPQYVAGEVELGVVQQAAAAFGHVLEDLSLIINEFESLTAFSASIGRLHQFLRAIQAADPDRDETFPLLGTCSDNKGIPSKDGLFKPTSQTKTTPLAHSSSTEDTISLRQLESSPDSSHPFAMSIRDVRLETPDRHRTLIRSLNLDLKWGERLLIHGASGIGKSSLLRAIAGLWTSGSGVIERANTSDVYFLPQRPYCPLGTLREQLLYPETNVAADSDTNAQQTSKTSKISDMRLLEILAAVDLADLPSRVGDGDDIAGLDATADWSNMLSLGEQQRLAFGRILVHQPRLIIVDEATSAMDVRAEETMYTLLRNLKSGDGGTAATYISVGHRPSLLGYHDVRLHLQKDEKSETSYSVTDIHSTRSADGLVSEEVAIFFR